MDVGVAGVKTARVVSEKGRSDSHVTSCNEPALHLPSGSNFEFRKVASKLEVFD